MQFTPKFGSFIYKIILLGPGRLFHRILTYFGDILGKGQAHIKSHDRVRASAGTEVQNINPRFQFAHANKFNFTGKFSTDNGR